MELGCYLSFIPRYRRGGICCPRLSECVSHFSLQRSQFLGRKAQALDDGKTSQLCFRPACFESPGVCLVRPQP